MKPVVIDASVIWKWHFPEPNTDDCLGVLNMPCELHAPRVAMDQIGLGLAKRVRRKELEVDQATRILANIRRLPITWTPTTVLAENALEISTLSSRGFVDCLHVALAIQHQTWAVTGDRRWFAFVNTGFFRNHVMWVGDFVKPVRK